MIFSFVFVFDVQSQGYITVFILVNVLSVVMTSACHIAQLAFFLMTVVLVT